MRSRVFSAVSAVLLCVVSSIADAMVVPDAAAEIPSSFSSASGPDDAGPLRNPATARLVESVRIFSRTPVRPRTFDLDASRGITYPSADLRTPSLEELIVIASVDPSRYVGADGRLHRSDSAETVLDFEPETERRQGTIRDLAKALVNRADPAPDADRSAGQDNSPGERTGTYRYFQALLDAELDKEFVEAVSEVVSPSVTPNGVVALNFLGARDFAFLTSPITNKIQIVDFSTGITLTVSHGTDNPPVVSPPPARQVNQPAQLDLQARPASKPLLVRLIKLAHDIAVHPLTLLGLAVAAAFSVFLRIARARAG